MVGNKTFSRIQFLTFIITIISTVLFMTSEARLLSEKNTELNVLEKHMKNHVSDNDTLVFKNSPKDSIKSESMKSEITTTPSGIKNEKQRFNFSDLKFVYGLLALVAFIVTIFYGWIEKQILRYKTKSRKLANSIIIEKRSSVIDWYDLKNGLAIYYEEVYFYKIGRLKEHIGNLKIDGKILCDSIQNINCYYDLNSDQNEVLTSYVNSVGGLNKVKSLVRSYTDYYIFKAVLKDSFKIGKDFWGLSALNYCKFVDLKIILPEELKVDNCKFIKIMDENDRTKDVSIKGIDPITLKHNGRDAIFIKLADIDAKESYEIQWSSSTI